MSFAAAYYVFLIGVFTAGALHPFVFQIEGRRAFSAEVRRFASKH